MRLFQQLLCIGLCLGTFACSKLVPSAHFNYSDEKSSPVTDIKTKTTDAILETESGKWQGKLDFRIALTVLSRNSNSPSTHALANPPTSAIRSTENIEILNGVDLSKWQGVVNFEQVKKAGNTYVFIKATQGNQDSDPDYAKNMQAARDAGLVAGSYHFYMPNDTPASQFEYFSTHLNIKNGDLPPVVDIEVLHGSHREDLTKNLKQFLTLIEQKYHLKPIIYTGRNFANQYLNGFQDYPLWLAEYNSAREPQLPLDWKTWTFWQHTADGSTQGVAGPVDLNRFNGSTEQFKALLVAMK